MKVDGKYRLIDYKQTFFIFWILTLLILGNQWLDPMATLNFYPAMNTTGIVLCVLILIFIVLQIVSAKISTLEKAQATIEKVKDNFHFLPKSKTEFIWFNFLAVSAGICEEIIFRLFIFTYILEFTHVTAAFIVTNLIFALTHIGSGKQNIINVFVLGLIFTAIYYFSNNIWLAIVLHIAIDINIGVIGYYSYLFKAKGISDISEV